MWSKNLEKAQAAAASAVELMRIAARNEANALYAKMAAESRDDTSMNVNIDLDLDAETEDVAVFDGAWWDAWAREQASSQKIAAEAALAR